MAEPTARIEEIVTELPAAYTEAKAGYRTTEFWLSIVTGALVVLNGIPMPEKYEGFAATAIAAIYALSRGLAKRGVAAPLN